MLATKTLTIDDFVLFSEKLQVHGLFEFINGQIVPVQSTEPLDENFVEQVLSPDFTTENRFLSFPEATQNHDRIVSNLHFYLQLASKNINLYVYSQGTAIKANRESYKPDIVLVNKNAEIRENHYILNPIVVIEVLSKSTQAKDRVEKLDNYQTIPELTVYLLISQNEKKIWAYERIDADTWQERILKENHECITLQNPALELKLEDIYEEVVF